MSALLQDVRFGLRMLTKNPVFTVVAVISLAIGIGLNTAVFSIINTIFYQSIRGVPNPGEVVFFNTRVSHAAYQHLREHSRSFAGITGSSGANLNVSYREYNEQVRVSFASDNYFSVLGARAAQGRLFSPAKQNQNNSEPEVVLGYWFWQNRLGGDPEILGKSILLNGMSFSVIGICAPRFHGAGPEEVTLWAPLNLFPVLANRSTTWNQDRQLGMLARLAPNVELSQAQSELEVVVAQQPELFADVQFRLSKGREDWRGPVAPEKHIEFLLVTVVPLVVVAAMLWITCSNVSNLLLARAVTRRKEMAIRLASGAGRWQVIRLLLVESLLLSFLGGVAGLVVSVWTIDFIFATLSNFSTISVQLDQRVLVYTAGICVLSALLFGFIPALQASKAEIATALKDSGTNSGFHRSKLRSFFLATQIASSVALLLVAGTFVKSLLAEVYFSKHAQHFDHLLLVQLRDTDGGAARKAELSHEASERLRALPEVKAVAWIENQKRSSILLEGREVSTNKVYVDVQKVEPDFLQVFDVPLLQGENLPSDASGISLEPALINESALKRLWASQPAIGARFTLDGSREFRVVGVVQDHGRDSRIYTSLKAPAERATLLVRTVPESSRMLPVIGQMLQSLEPNRIPPHVATYRDAALGPFAQITQIALLIGLLALCLAAAGIYASVAFATSQRTHEIGVRMALGATRVQVVKLVLMGCCKVVGWGAALGTALALIGIAFLSKMIFGRWPLDLTAFVGVVFVFTTVAFLASLIPARRAARVDPMVALRYE